MVTRVFGMFGYWAFGGRIVEPPAGPRPAVPGAYAEALLAGWVPPLPEVRDKIRAAGTATEKHPDIAAFLQRFYLHQHC